MTTTSAPETVPVKADQGDDATHIVCCDDNTALCGLDVSDQPWTGDEDDVDCPLCVLVEEAPGCPRCRGLRSLLWRIVGWRP